MKKFFIVIVMIIGVASVAHATDSGFVALAPIPGLTDTGAGSLVDSATLAKFFNNLYKYLIGLAAILAVIEIIRAGFEISAESITKKTDGKKRIKSAIGGLILVLSPVLVFSIINKSILNLSLNLPPLDTSAAIPIGSSNSGNSALTPPTAPESGCTPPKGGSYIQVASCASQKDAQSYNQCGTGLTLWLPPTPACKTKDAKGNCLDKTVSTVYCMGKNTTLAYYRYWGGTLGLLYGTETPIPDNRSDADTFKSGCGGDGGAVTYQVTAASKVFLSTQAYRVSSGCPADSKITVDANKYKGVVCYSVMMYCVPPAYASGVTQ